MGKDTLFKKHASQMDSHMQMTEVGPLLYTTIQNESKT